MRPGTQRKVIYEATRLEILDKLNLGQALEVAAAIGGMARSHQWWAGDLLVYAEAHFDEAFAQVEAELGIGAHTALNWRYVAKHVEVSRRREDLAWSQHAEVARLGSKAQREVLARAAKEGWTVRQTRDYVALTFPQSGETPLFTDSGGGGGSDDVNLQKRLEKIEHALESFLREEGEADLAEYVTPEDVAFLVDELKRATRSGRGS